MLTMKVDNIRQDNFLLFILYSLPLDRSSVRKCRLNLDETSVVSVHFSYIAFCIYSLCEFMFLLDCRRLKLIFAHKLLVKIAICSVRIVHISGIAWLPVTMKICRRRPSRVYCTQRFLGEICSIEEEKWMNFRETEDEYSSVSSKTDSYWQFSWLLIEPFLLLLLWV